MSKFCVDCQIWETEKHFKETYHTGGIPDYRKLNLEHAVKAQRKKIAAHDQELQELQVDIDYLTEQLEASRKQVREASEIIEDLQETIRRLKRGR